MGKSRQFSLKYTAIVSAASATVLFAPLSLAEAQQGAPISYAGQSNFQPASTSFDQSHGAGQATGAPIRFAGTSYQIASSAAPAYAYPVSAQAASARTKRIEFRYPDQPNVVHSTDDRIRATGNPKPTVAAPSSNPPQTQAPRQYAAVGAPTLITPQRQNPPVLHQPHYNKPIIEEVSMGEALMPAAQPLSAIEQGTPTIQPVAQPGFEERGIASWYGDEFHGQPTANGEIFDMTALSAAHPTLPLPSLVQVTNLSNNREVVVRVNDRGPFEPNRMIDLSKRAADELGFLVEGEAKVSVRYLGPAPVAADTFVGQGEPIKTQATTDKPAQATTINPQSYPQPKMKPIPNPVDNSFFIQAGSFSQMENAQRLSFELGGSLPVDVVLANVHGADFFRVLIGPYRSRADAAMMRDQLAAGAIVDGIVVKAN